MPSVLGLFPVTIPDAGTEPVAGIDLINNTIVGVYIPAGLEGTTLGFKAAATLAGTYLALYGTDGNAVSYIVGASRYVSLDPSAFSGVQFLKPVVPSQTGAIVLTFATRRLG